MVSTDEVTAWALALPNVVQLPHFEKTSFRIKKKIFATLDSKKRKLMVVLSAVDQSVFIAFDSAIIYPVPGAWGKQGCTFIELSKVRKSIAKDALRTAHQYLLGKMKR
jgi:hypothetical protein